jgi:hypothetical protein
MSSLWNKLVTLMKKSHVRSSPTAANQNHAYEEEHTFIQSEQVDNEGQGKKSC